MPPAAVFNALALLPDRVTQRMTGRATSAFQADIDRLADQLADALRDARVVVAGGAGSIGAAVCRELLRFDIAALDVLDTSENALVELVRDVRSSSLAPAADRLRTFTVPLGTPLGLSLLRRYGPYDYALNFAALKHVRAERDPLTLLRMVEVNLIEARAFWDTLRGLGVGHAFAVSSDKACYPSSMMGATKRLMEYLLFDHEARVASAGIAPAVTSTRFANVAFSQGSLLDGFVRRLARRQPLAGPSNVRRYFYSFDEAAQICLLAAFTTPSGHIVVPNLAPDSDLGGFRAAAALVLEQVGLQPIDYDDPSQARDAVEREVALGRYPCVFTPANTDGEKSDERFTMAHEQLVDVGLARARAIRFDEPESSARLERFFRDAIPLLQQPSPELDKTALVRLFDAALPELRHVRRGRSLDQIM